MSTPKDYIKKMIDEVLAIETQEAKEAGALGYMARALVQATMPHRDPGNVEAWGRENGAFSMVMQPGVMSRGREIIRIGLPYGSIPRLLLAWMTREAVLTQSPTLILGQTLSRFMNQLDLVPTGGRWGSITRLREQMKRLFSASVSCYYDEKYLNHKNDQPELELARVGFNITKSYQLWWNPKSPEQAAIWESEVTLSKDFFDEITDRPIPIDMRALKALKRSPMALDIYCWLTYRMSYLKRMTEIPWIGLQMQFGSSYSQNDQGIRDFKRAFLRELKKVCTFYQEAKVESGNNGLILRPSLTHIPILTEEEIQIKQPLSTTKKIEAEKIADKANKQLVESYRKYRLEQLVNIIENRLEKDDKKKFFIEFSQYLTRGEAKNINADDLQDKKTLEWLHRFTDNYWHNILEQIKSFDDFKATSVDNA